MESRVCVFGADQSLLTYLADRNKKLWNNYWIANHVLLKVAPEQKPILSMPTVAGRPVADRALCL